uniref:Uncharacterized protein n=1 Tax=Anguilla anguilla TaxID=7936 RepID=A0A0E9WVD9_ANGAN
MLQHKFFFKIVECSIVVLLVAGYLSYNHWLSYYVNMIRIVNPVLLCFKFYILILKMFPLCACVKKNPVAFLVA